MRQWAVRLSPLFGVAVAACNFHVPSAGEVDASAGDTAADTAGDAADAPAGALCAPDAQLLLCFSFDQVPLPTALANEGSAAVSAKLLNVQQIASPEGSAALVDATSSIVLPFAAGVTGVLSTEVWFRVDTDPGIGGRSGLLDSNVSQQNISMFWNHTGATTHQLTCGVGDQATPFVVPVAVGAWTYAACTCEGTTVSIYIDGVFVASATGDCGTGGAFVGDGLAIGANNQGAGQPVNDNLVGAIDGVRLWSRVLSASEIARHLGVK